VLCSWIEDQSVLKYDSCFQTGLDHFDLRQKTLPLIIRLDLVSVEALDSGEQADTTRLPCADNVLLIRKEVARDKRDPTRQNPLLD